MCTLGFQWVCMLGVSEPGHHQLLLRWRKEATITWCAAEEPVSTFVPSSPSPPPSLCARLCPVQIAELDNPVEDQKGFIYERSAIVAAINQAQQADHCNWVECPLPGVSHAVMLHHLKPVNKRRLQMQAQRRPTQPDRRGVVLDA